ncbi:Amino-acid acetyltransferase, mitochondrial [Taxawa tesnikishii (nom. ined.)]|nr:Amino-acid acetyltransferase, mitochondrial [Dothideales sp. JES 119]
MQLSNHRQARCLRAAAWHSPTRQNHSSAARLAESPSKDVPGPPRRNGNGGYRDKLLQRDFFLDVLNVSATRRDAKQYLARFKAPTETKPTKSAELQKVLKERQEQHNREQWQLHRTGVNLGGLYEPTRAIAQSPTFVQHTQQEQRFQENSEILHIALVSIRAPQSLEDHVLAGIALTIAQLVRLDMQIVVALNCTDNLNTTAGESSWDDYKRLYQEEGGRVVAALEEHNNAGARYVDAALSFDKDWAEKQTTAGVQGSVNVEIPKLIIDPLKRGAVPVIPALAHTPDFRAVPVSPEDVVLGLTRCLSGITMEKKQHRTSTIAAQESPDVQTSLDRIIMLDPLGGLPSAQREDRAHVFVNLEQEYDDIRNELRAAEGQDDENSDADSVLSSPSRQHIRNLNLLRDCLTLLPPETSALLITPEEAASSSEPSARNGELTGIATRRQKNVLIHNLLTNKPTISSSLPVARLSSPTHSPSAAMPQTPVASHPTLVKRGMPLSIVPNPRTQPWRPPQPGEQTISLEDHPDINFPRLLHLIEDSFRRPLDVQHYLARIRNRVAGVIIAGEYEGGAILTWEMPPSPSPSSRRTGPSGEPPRDHTRLVPYLDKFAVLQRSQGSSGVADIVFQAMVRSCFPSGVCWRSRQDNPVNKWYFERSKGIWKLHDSMWTMFWTTEGLVEDEVRWKDYVDVCRSIQASWADKKKPD